MPNQRIRFQLPEDFYSRYWQREPLLIRNAVANFDSPVSGDDLAGLACLEEVAYRKGFIDKEQMAQIIQDTPKSSYRDYLDTVLKNGY